MTWNCASCGTTLTYAEPVTAYLSCRPGMTKCPRCDKWMDLVTESATTEGAA